MKICRASCLGFCFGVRRAVDIACGTANRPEPVYIIGDIVHNEGVSSAVQKAGVKKVASLKKIPAKAFLIIKAHGVPASLYTAARQKKIKLVDATCPMVKDIQNKAALCEKKGYQVVIVGDKKHDEVRGIIGHTRFGMVIEHPDQVAKKIKQLKKKIAVLCQSTQDIDNVAAIVQKLTCCVEELSFFNTICRETRRRQKEVKDLAGKCQAVLVIGSQKSANTTRLYNIARALNKNTFFIRDEKGICPGWKKFSSLALIGGASTPVERITAIERKLYDL